MIWVLPGSLWNTKKFGRTKQILERSWYCGNVSVAPIRTRLVISHGSHEKTVKEGLLRSHLRPLPNHAECLFVAVTAYWSYALILTGTKGRNDPEKTLSLIPRMTSHSETGH